MAKTLTKPQSRSYQVKAITEQLNNQQTTAARRSLQSLKTQNSTPEQTVEYLFLQAQLNSELLKY